MVDFSTELAERNAYLLENQKQQHELNNDLKEENILLLKKVQSKLLICLQNILKCIWTENFFLRTYKLSPLKYTIPKFETFWVKIGDVTGVQSSAILPWKMVFKSRGQNVKMSRDVT